MNTTEREKPRVEGGIWDRVEEGQQIVGCDNCVCVFHTKKFKTEQSKRRSVASSPEQVAT